MAAFLAGHTKTEVRLCPLCGVNDEGKEVGDRGTLSLRQINSKEAIYVCNNPNCIYPVGEEVVVVERIVPELLSDYCEDFTPTPGLQNSKLANYDHACCKVMSS